MQWGEGHLHSSQCPGKRTHHPCQNLQGNKAAAARLCQYAYHHQRLQQYRCTSLLPKGHTVITHGSAMKAHFSTICSMACLTFEYFYISDIASPVTAPKKFILQELCSFVVAVQPKPYLLSLTCCPPFPCGFSIFPACLLRCPAAALPTLPCAGPAQSPSDLGSPISSARRSLQKGAP